jgi:DNA-binding beta-propeller fold protein YncE
MNINLMRLKKILLSFTLLHLFNLEAYCDTPLHSTQSQKISYSIRIFLLLSAFLLLSLSTSPPALANPEAFVINNLAETLSRIDLVTGAVQNHITVLGDTPNQIAYSDGYLYILNSTSADLQKVDPQSYLAVFDMPLTIGSNPFDVALDSSYAYVSCLVTGELDRIDLNSGQLHGNLPIGGCPEGILIYGDKLYVAQTGFNPSNYSYGQGRMAIINLNSFSLEREVNVGKNPQSIFLAPDGKLHIVCTGNYSDVSGAIYMYNPISDAVEDSILIGGQPSMGAVSPDGIAFLAAGGWVNHGYIYSYNTATFEILRGPANPIFSGLGVWTVALDSLGFIYSCDYNNDTVTKLNSSGQVIATYAMGDGPQSIVILGNRASDISDDPDNPIPETIGLLGNYPNPFNAETSIQYRLPHETLKASIAIFNIEGREINRLNLGTTDDIGKVIWNGRNGQGENCVSGLYFARLVAELGKSSNSGSFRAIKLLLIR